MILGVGSISASLLAGALLAAPASAESPGAAASATAHALEERANCFAQHRPECPTLTPLPSPTPTPTPAPTSAPSATATLAAPPPTDTPAPAPTATPCWLVDADLGDPESGYVVFDSTSGVPLPCASALPADEPAEPPTPTLAPTPTFTIPPTPLVEWQVVYVQQPAPPPRTVYVEVTAAPRVEYILAPTATSASTTTTTTPSPTRSPTPTRSLPTRTPTPTSTSRALPTATPAPPTVVVNSSISSPPRQPVPVDHVPLPMLPSFGLLAITRKETTLPWLWPLPFSE